MENKYRAYIKWAKIILEVEIIDFKRKRVYCKTEMNKPNPCDFYNFDDIILMQYTGLKDKNGVEIYEGNIVRVIDDIGYYGMGIVVFCLGSFCFEWIDDSEANIEPIITTKKINNNQELEVIGNIYENPDLLKG